MVNRISTIIAVSGGRCSGGLFHTGSSNQWGFDMKKLLISTSAVATVALTSAPAFATPVSASANAKAKIYRPLTITKNTDLDFATIVLGPGTYSNTVIVSQAGSITCGANVTCSGTPAAANFKLTGTNNSTAAISLSASSITLAGTNTPANTLTLTLSAPATVALGATGTTGTNFGVGGSLTVTNATADDLYTGTFTVNADYQ
jgi:hypothetical protein